MKNLQLRDLKIHFSRNFHIFFVNPTAIVARIPPQITLGFPTRTSSGISQ